MRPLRSSPRTKQVHPRSHRDFFGYVERARLTFGLVNDRERRQPKLEESGGCHAHLVDRDYR